MLAAEVKDAQYSAPAPCVAPYWERIIEPVKPFLAEVSQRLLDQVDSFDPSISSYVQYAISNQGKQLRPSLVALSAGCCGPLTEDHAQVAVIIEMVHLATLVHDDVIDEAELRRGRPTMAANWGNHLPVLVGDCLFAQALKLAATFPTPVVCRAVAAAANTVCTGEILQSQGRGMPPSSRSEYFRILKMKTAELFALSCEMGAVLSQDGSNHQAALRAFGLQLGIAYQIYDDCVDLFGSETTAGKSLGTDLAKGKLTLPWLSAWERADSVERAALCDFHENGGSDHAEGLCSLLGKLHALEDSRAAIHKYLDDAHQSLAILPQSDSLQALDNILDYLAVQADKLHSVSS